MSAEIFNQDQVRLEITKAVAEYQAKLQDRAISKESLISLIESLLVDRQLIIDEIDEMKEIQDGWFPNMFRRRHSNFKMMIDDLDESVYNDLSNLAIKLDLPSGDVLSFLMKEVVSHFDGTFPELSGKMLEPLHRRKMLNITISSQETLSVSHQDLVEMGAKVSFNSIDVLQFVDVDLETFKTFVGNINHCGLIQVPATFSKLLVYAKCNHCGLIEFYDGPTPPESPKSSPNQDSWHFHEVKQLAREARQVKQEARIAMKEVRQAKREARIEMKKAQQGLEGCRRDMKEIADEAQHLQMKSTRLGTIDSQIPQSFFNSLPQSPYGSYNSLESSKKTYNRAHMAEMAAYLQDVQEYVRRNPH